MIRSALSSRDYAVAGLVVFAAIIIVILVLAILTSDNSLTYAQTARRACQHHHGVRSVDFDRNVAVCLDGYVADTP